MTVFAEWTKRAGCPKRLDTLQLHFPAEVAAFNAMRDNGHESATDESNAYRWDRRLLEDVVRALGRICPP